MYKTLKLCFYLYMMWIAMSCFTIPAFALVPVDIDRLKEERPYLHFEYLIEKDRRLTIDDILSQVNEKKHQWQSSRNESMAFGFKNKGIWVRFHIRNSTNEHILWYLQQKYPLIDNIQLYLPRSESGVDVIKAGDHLPFSERPIAHRSFVFPIETQAHTSNTYYLRFASTSPINISLAVLSSKRFEKQKDTEAPFLWMYYGIIIIMFIYNFFIYISVWDKSYLYYLLYTFFFLIWVMGINGTAFQYFWPESPWIVNYANMLAAMLLTAALIQFVRFFIDVKKYSVFFDRLFFILVCINVIWGGIGLIINDYRFISKYGIPINTISVILPLCIVIYLAAVKKSRQALFISIAFIVFLTGILLLILKSVGLLPINFLTSYGFQVGSALEIVLLSLGLADRINIMRKELAVHRNNLEKMVEKRTEQLITAQKELVEKAHKAGMADIAAGTLHNVGNVLNSLKISAQVCNEAIKKSKTLSFKKANDLLRDNEDRLAEFLISDPKGKKLPEYYFALEDVMETEREVMTHNLDRLLKKASAIEDIISAQQNYAGVEALVEEYTLSEIVQDALIIQSGTMEKYDIRIEKKYLDVPKIRIQKTKLVHIVINLVKNAKEAMYETPPQSRTLNIFINHDGKAVYMRVQDNGHGIASENLKKIFSYGFTTKKNGHGFGLHSSANYMTEMGGEMWAESDGQGKGSTFVLKFPISQPV